MLVTIRLHRMPPLISRSLTLCEELWGCCSGWWTVICLGVVCANVRRAAHVPAVFAMLWLNGYRPVLVAVGLVIKYCLADLTMYLGLAVFGRYPL
jgi:hypothetical protein